MCVCGVCVCVCIFVCVCVCEVCLNSMNLRVSINLYVDILWYIHHYSNIFLYIHQRILTHSSRQINGSGHNIPEDIVV